MVGIKSLEVNTRLQSILLICATGPFTPSDIQTKTGYGYNYLVHLLRKLEESSYIFKSKRKGRHTYYVTTKAGKDFITQHCVGKFYVLNERGSN